MPSITDMGENYVVCYCYEVGRDRLISYMPQIKEELRDLLKDGMIHPKDTPTKIQYCISRLGALTKAGTHCQTCQFEREPSIEDIVKRELARRK